MNAGVQAFVHSDPRPRRLKGTGLYLFVALLVLVKSMDDEKVTTSRRTDDVEREEPLHNYVGGEISNPEPKKTGRKKEPDTSSKTGAKKR